MANVYTTAKLLTDMKRAGHVPPSQTPFLPADLLAMGDYELQTALLRQILSVRENFYLTYEDFDLNGTSVYEIPTRAIGGALAEVHIVNESAILKVGRTELGDQFSTLSSPTGYYSFYLKGNSVVILPAPSGGVIRLWYYRIPNQMIVTTSAAQITAINSNVLTCTSVPSGITTSVACDIIQDQPHFNTLDMDATPTAVTSTTITFTSVPSTVSVGDWVAPAGQTPVPQIPVEFRPLLIQRVAVKYYEIQGYMEKMKAAQMKLEAMEKDLFMLINPRVVEEPKNIVADYNLIGGYRRSSTWLAT